MTVPKRTIQAEKKKGMRPRAFARHYGIGEYAVYQGIRRGEIPAVRVGQSFVVLIEEFERRRMPTKEEDGGDAHG